MQKLKKIYDDHLIAAKNAAMVSIAKELGVDEFFAHWKGDYKLKGSVKMNEIKISFDIDKYSNGNYNNLRKLSIEDMFKFKYVLEELIPRHGEYPGRHVDSFVVQYLRAVDTTKFTPAEIKALKDIKVTELTCHAKNAKVYKEYGIEL
jgi:hypothetical protein